MKKRFLWLYAIPAFPFSFAIFVQIHVCLEVCGFALAMAAFVAQKCIFNTIREDEVDISGCRQEDIAREPQYPQQQQQFETNIAITDALFPKWIVPTNIVSFVTIIVSGNAFHLQHKQASIRYLQQQ
eukprot:m.15505 g.15505  ORF g.15505 m.15505 type:complete len:127 (+) comp7863_c0_seq1:546-926(+)